MKEAKQEYTCGEERSMSQDHRIRPLDHRVRISCCYHDATPHVKGDETTSVIQLIGKKKNPPEQTRKLRMKQCKAAAGL